MGKYLLSILLLWVLLIGMNFRVEADYRIEPILPLEGTIIGVRVSEPRGNFLPYLGTAYDWSTSEIYYQAGFYSPWLGAHCSINYAYCLDQDLISYYYRKGFQVQLAYPLSAERNLSLGLFSGEVGRKSGEEARTTYLKLKYRQNLYFNKDWQVDLAYALLSGRVEESGKNYYTTFLKIPVKYKDLKLTGQLGYARQRELIAPYYSLSTYVKGYDAEEGNQLWSLALEKQYPLFPYTDKPILGLLKASLFATAGDVLEPGETLADLQVHSSAGLGLVLGMGEVDFRLDGVWTDQGQFKTLFSYQAAF